MEATALDAPPPSPAPAPAAGITFQEMRLRVGDRAQLSPPTQTGIERLSVSVVGWVEGSSLIVTAPRIASRRLDLQAGEYVLLRAFTGRRAYAFRCTVLKRSAAPFDYLHLSFPDKVEGLDVRNSPRYRVDLPGKAVLDSAGGPIDLRIENISTTGALLVSGEPLGAVGEAVKLDFSFVLHEVPVSLSLKCAVRSTKSDQDVVGASRYSHGVSFDAPAENGRLMLAALVWFHMYENPRLAA